MKYLSLWPLTYYDSTFASMVCHGGPLSKEVSNIGIVVHCSDIADYVPYFLILQ
jgi:hypothetical protein